MRRRERDARTMRTTMLRARERREGGSRGEEERGHKRAALRFTPRVHAFKGSSSAKCKSDPPPSWHRNDPSGRRSAHPLARLRRLVRGRPPDCGGGGARRRAPGPAVPGHGGRLHRVGVAQVRGHQLSRVQPALEITIEDDCCFFMYPGFNGYQFGSGGPTEIIGGLGRARARRAFHALMRSGRHRARTCAMGRATATASR